MERLRLPAYQVNEAARYARTTTRTIARWSFEGGSRGPMLPGREKKAGLSYLELVEVAFLASFRRAGVSAVGVREAHDYLRNDFRAEYPFAELRLFTDGKHVLMRAPDDIGHELRKVIVADKRGQYAWAKVLAERFEEFDYDAALAIRWHPAGRQTPVVIDPRVSFGTPSVRGISTFALKSRFEAGEQIDDLCEDFGLGEDEVRHALTFEGVRLAA